MYFCYWLIQGDGFDVTGWIIKNYLRCLCDIDEESFIGLAQLGRALHDRRDEALAFKKNSGRYVGNYNYRGLHDLTRRADLLLMCGLGIDSEVAITLFDEMQRVLSVNAFTGEKGIPDGLRDDLGRKNPDHGYHAKILSQMDPRIRAYLGISHEAYEFLLTRDLVLSGSSDSDEGDAD